MIVDDCSDDTSDTEMAKDPFLEAGIAIPAELPYQDESQRENSARMVVGKGAQSHASVVSSLVQQQPQPLSPAALRLSSQHPVQQSPQQQPGGNNLFTADNLLIPL